MDEVEREKLKRWSKEKEEGKLWRFGGGVVEW